ncbi:hypothetical protein ACS0TY_029510 [Phlomoides rotata]
MTMALLSLIALTHALWLMINIRPQVILRNRPGTCIPLCAIAYFSRFSGSGGFTWRALLELEDK